MSDQARTTQVHLLPPLEGARPSTLLLITESVRSAFRSLIAYKLRSALSVLAVTVGTLGVMTVIAVAQIAQVSVSAQLGALQTQMVSVSGFSIDPTSGGDAPSGPPSLTPQDVFTMERLPHVIAASPWVQVGGNGFALVAGNKTWIPGEGGAVEGVFPGVQAIDGYTLQSGAFFTDQDVTQQATNMVLGAAVAHVLFPDGQAIGEHVRLLHTDFTVVGVLAAQGTMNGQDRDNQAFVPFTTLVQKVVGPIKASRAVRNGTAVPAPGFGNIPFCFVLATSVADVPLVQQEITSALRQSHHLAAGAPDDFSAAGFAEGQDVAGKSLSSVKLGSAIVATVALLLGAFGIASVLFASVSERTREIGLRLAVGSEPASIRRQFLVEALALALLGGIIGVLIATGIKPLFGLLPPLRTGGFVFVPPTSLQGAVGALGASALLGLVAGFLPARRAAQLNPATALRRS